MDKTWVFVDRTGLGCWWITGWALKKKKKKSLLRPLSAPPRLRELLAVVQVCVEFWGALSLGNQGCLGRAERWPSALLLVRGRVPGAWTREPRRRRPRMDSPGDPEGPRPPGGDGEPEASCTLEWLGFRVFNSDWIAFSLVCFREIGKGRVLAVGIVSPWKGLKFGYWRDRMWSLMTFCGSTFK